MVCSGRGRFLLFFTIFDFRKSFHASLIKAAMDALVKLYSALNALQFTSSSLNIYFSGTSLYNSSTIVLFFFLYYAHSFIV
jgi:hypothetical protein